MWTAGRIVDTLRRRGELWEPVPGLVGLRGDALDLFRAFERLFEEVARAEGHEEWALAPGLRLDTLARAGYFESFPQWLTAAGHLSDDPATLEAVATSADPAETAARSVQPAGCALSPALCYHVYARLEGTTVDRTRLTSRGTCWRHEGERTSALERGWAFTMRELVAVGAPDEIAGFRRHGMALGVALASNLGLDARIEAATDPFFAPTARGRELLQRVKALKHELTLPLGDGRRTAAASFNDHERFFGDAFDIRLADGRPAASGCVAFGIERWTLAFMVAHGPDARRWPPLGLEIASTRPDPYPATPTGVTAPGGIR